MRPYNKIIKKAENLLRDIKIKSQKNVMSGIPIEVYKNYCLDYAERLSKLKNITKNQKFEGRKRIFDVYFKLQDYEGPERQTEKGQEIPFSSLQSTNAYKGGLGFSGISDALFLQASGPKVNQYWKPPPKKPVVLIPKKDYGIIQADYEKVKEETLRMDLDEFHDEMKRQKEELLYEVRKLRETSDTDKGDILIL